MRTYKRIIAMLVTISMVLSVLPQFAVAVWADDTDNVVMLWGKPDGEDIDPATLVIGDTAPDDDYVIAAKFINSGTYTATADDLAYALLVNNALVDATSLKDLELDYYLSGFSQIKFPNINVACDDNIMSAFDGDASDPAQIAEFYSPDKYSGWDGDHFNFIRYDYCITGEFHGGLDAQALLVDEHATYVIDNWSRGEGDNTYYGANVTNASVVDVYGELIVKDNDGLTDRSNELNIEKYLLVRDGGSVTGTGNGRINVLPGFHAEDFSFFKYDSKAPSGKSVIEFPNNDELSFEYVTDGEESFWVAVAQNQEAVPECGQLAVYFDDYTFFEDQEDAEVPHAFVYYNDVSVLSGVPVDFEVESEFVLGLETYRDYDISECTVEIRQATGIGDEVEIFSTESEDPAYLLTIDDNNEIKFTPTRDNPIYVNVFWCDLDKLQPDDDQIRFDIYSWGPGKYEVGGTAPIEACIASNGTYRAIFDKSDFEDGAEITVTFTPQTGASLTYYGYAIDELNENYEGNRDDPDGIITFPDAEYLTDNGDGSFTFKIGSFGSSEDGPIIASVSAGFEFAYGLPGFSFDTRGSRVFYSLDGGASYEEIFLEHFSDEFGEEWDEYFLDMNDLGDATEVTFMFEIPDDEKEWKEFYSVYVELFNYRRYAFNAQFDSDDAYEITLEKPECGWLPVHISPNEWHAPFLGTYMIYLKGDGAENVNINADGLEEPAAFTVGEPIEFTITDEIYGVYVRTVESNAETKLNPVSNVYSYTPDSTSGVVFNVYVTEEEYLVDHMWPEGENERDLEFWVNNDGFPEDVTAGSVELLENDHIRRFVSSCGHNRLIVEYDPEEVENEPAIIGFKLNVPEKTEFSVWLNGNDLTPMVYQKYEDTGEYILELDITGRITRWEPFNLDINFAYHEFAGDDLVAHYDSRYYPDEGNAEERPHAELIVNGERLDPNSSVKFNVGEEITFKLVPPEEYENYDFDLAMVRIHQWDDENNEEEFFDSEFDNDHKIVISSTGEFKFTPTRWGTIFVDVDWSAFDSIHTEGDQVQIELNRWGNGTISFGDMIEPVAFAESPYGDGRTRAVFNASDLDGEGKIEVIFTPDYGYALNKVVFDNSGFEHTEYVLDPNDPNGYPISELDGFVDNKDGTYTYTIDSFDIAKPDEWNNSFININADFGNPLGCEGVSIDSKGAKVYYKLDGDEDFTELPVREFEDEWNKWEEIRLTPEEFMDSSTVTFKFVFEDGRTVEGVELCYYENGERRSYRPFYDPSNYEYVLKKPEEGWANYRLTLMDYVAPFDGQYLIYALGEDAEEIKIEGYTLGQTLDFTLGKPITFSFDHEVYGVYLTNRSTFEEIELIPENGVYSYTPDSYDPLEFKIFMTEVEFELCHLHAEGEYEREVEFWIDRWDFPEGADIGDVIIPENANVKKWINSCGHVKLIVEWEGLSPEGAFIDLTVKVPEFTELHIWENGGEADAQVVDGTYVYSWDITGVFTGQEWSSPRFVLQYLPGITLMDMPEGVGAEYSTDGGKTFKAVEGDRITLYSDIPNVKFRFVKLTDAQEVYGIHLSIGSQDFRERLESDLIYDFERGERWHSYYVEPITEDNNFDFEWRYEFAMEEDKDIVVFKSNVKDINNFARYDTVTIKAENVYCIEAIDANGEIRRFSKNGNTFKLVTSGAAGFTAYIYTSQEEYDYVHLFPTNDQRSVYYYTDSESAETGTVSVAGEVARASYNGMTKVIYVSEDSNVVFTITPAENYYYTAMQGENEFSGTINADEWPIVWPVIEFYKKTDVSDATVTLDPAGDQIYTGSAITPSVKVVIGDTELTADVDYTVAYTGNVEAGTATVTITGIGKFMGTATATFNIVKAVYTVTVVCSDNGTATVSKLEANEGDEITVTATPAEGFELDSIKLDDVAISGTTFTMPAKNVTVTVTFKEKVPAKNGWILDNGNYYYYDNGVMVTGWKSDGGKWYYLDPETGIMAKGWLDLDGTWYYLNNSGAMMTGWQSVGSKWYFFESSGAMAKGWKQSGGVWYYLTSSGAMATGWQAVDGEWYYFESSGAMTNPGWKQIGGSWYYFKKSGAMACYEYCEGYWLDSSGAWTYKYKATWRGNDTDGWWFGDETGWYAKNETLTIDGKDYKFDAQGYWVKN